MAAGKRAAGQVALADLLQRRMSASAKPLAFPTRDETALIKRFPAQPPDF
jgi:hypothetical protein